MPFPPEYQRATDHFYDFLEDVKQEAGFGSAHQAYTMAQGVFQAFRRRLSLQDAIRFSNVLPVGLRALFVADWDPGQPARPFVSREAMTAEVKALRAEHNFSTDTAIHDVAVALRKHVDTERFGKLLAQLPKEASEFWAV